MHGKASGEHVPLIPGLSRRSKVVGRRNLTCLLGLILISPSAHGLVLSCRRFFLVLAAAGLLRRAHNPLPATRSNKVRDPAPWPPGPARSRPALDG